MPDEKYKEAKDYQFPWFKLILKLGFWLSIFTITYLNKQLFILIWLIAVRIWENSIMLSQTILNNLNTLGWLDQNQGTLALFAIYFGIATYFLTSVVPVVIVWQSRWLNASISKYNILEMMDYLDKNMRYLYYGDSSVNLPDISTISNNVLDNMASILDKGSFSVRREASLRHYILLLSSCISISDQANQYSKTSDINKTINMPKKLEGMVQAQFNLWLIKSELHLLIDHPLTAFFRMW